MGTRRRHTPEQIIRKLRAGEKLIGDGQGLAEVCTHLEISEPTWYRWVAQYGGIKVALRELQQLRLTYGVPGRGTFVHPDAVDLLRGNLMREPVSENDPALRQRVADYLATQNDLFTRFHAARTPADREKIVNDLVHHADQHRQLIEQMARYQSAEDGSDETPTPRRRTTPTKATKTGPTTTTSRRGSRRSP